jgi:hypothetical protein
MIHFKKTKNKKINLDKCSSQVIIIVVSIFNASISTFKWFYCGKIKRNRSLLEKSNNNNNKK